MQTAYRKNCTADYSHWCEQTRWAFRSAALLPVVSDKFRKSALPAGLFAVIDYVGLVGELAALPAGTELKLPQRQLYQE